MKQKIVGFLFILIGFIFCSYYLVTYINLNSKFVVGEEIDSLNHVSVYFNGGVNQVTERNLTQDGYNLGLKYQCVEFVKRYYYQYFKHKMPDTYGHAKDFFDPQIKNGGLNIKRGLYQFINGQGELPQQGDLLIFTPSLLNRYGHVAIVAQVDIINLKIEIIQQNAGPFSQPRELYVLSSKQENWRIKNNRILGWLRI